MILLSNHTTKAKVIGLKPISFPTQAFGEEEPNELADYQHQLENVKEAFIKTKVEADHLIKEAKEHIKQEQEKWQEEKKQWIDDAKQVGYQEGLQTGKTEGHNLYQSHIEEAESIIKLAEQKKKTLLDQSEPSILEMSVTIASKIINKQLTGTDDYIEIVKKVLQEVRDQPAIKIYAHPVDFKVLEAHYNQLTALLDQMVTLSIYPSIDLNEGDCIVETPYSKIDVGVDSQLNAVSQQLIELMEEINREF